MKKPPAPAGATVANDVGSFVDVTESANDTANATTDTTHTTPLMSVMLKMPNVTHNKVIYLVRTTTCICQNGINEPAGRPAFSHHCPRNFDNNCEFCYSGYSKNGNLCQGACSCRNGNPAKGVESCPVPMENCASCPDDNYDLLPFLVKSPILGGRRNFCKPICSCEGGKRASGRDSVLCPRPQESCKQCFEGYQMVEKSKVAALVGKDGWAEPHPGAAPPQANIGPTAPGSNDGVIPDPSLVTATVFKFGAAAKLADAAKNINNAIPGIDDPAGFPGGGGKDMANGTTQFTAEKIKQQIKKGKKIADAMSHGDPGNKTIQQLEDEDVEKKVRRGRQLMVKDHPLHEEHSCV